MLFFDAGTPLQVFFALLVSAYSHVAHAHFRPFVEPAVFRLQHFSLLTTTAVYALGLLFKVGAITDSESAAQQTGLGADQGIVNGLGLLLVLMVIAFLVASVVVGTRQLYAEVRRQKLLANAPRLQRLSQSMSRRVSRINTPGWARRIRDLSGRPGGGNGSGRDSSRGTPGTRGGGAAGIVGGQPRRAAGANGASKEVELPWLDNPLAPSAAAASPVTGSGPSRAAPAGAPGSRSKYSGFAPVAAVPIRTSPTNRGVDITTEEVPAQALMTNPLHARATGAKTAALTGTSVGAGTGSRDRAQEAVGLARKTTRRGAQLKEEAGAAPSRTDSAPTTSRVVAPPPPPTAPPASARADAHAREHATATAGADADAGLARGRRLEALMSASDATPPAASARERSRGTAAGSGTGAGAGTGARGGKGKGRGRGVQGQRKRSQAMQDRLNKMGIKG